MERVMKKIFRVSEVRMGGGYSKAVLLDGQETVFGADAKELAERLKIRLHVLRAKPLGKFA